MDPELTMVCKAKGEQWQGTSQTHQGGASATQMSVPALLILPAEEHS